MERWTVCNRPISVGDRMSVCFCGDARQCNNAVSGLAALERRKEEERTTRHMFKSVPVRHNE